MVNEVSVINALRKMSKQKQQKSAFLVRKSWSSYIGSLFNKLRTSLDELYLSNRFPHYINTQPSLLSFHTGSTSWLALAGVLRPFTFIAFFLDQGHAS